MAEKTARCTCPADGKLVFLGHLKTCPEVVAQIVELITTQPGEPFPTIMEMVYYVNRDEVNRGLPDYAMEHAMLRHVIHTRVLGNDEYMQQTAWMVAEELLEYVEENPRKVTNAQH